MCAQYINNLTSAGIEFQPWQCMQKIQGKSLFPPMGCRYTHRRENHKNVEHLQMVNEKSNKFVFDRGIFWVHGISV